MEPCAPGTEDDQPIMFSTLNKQENEKERLLSQKAILKNGKYDTIFELSYVNGAEHWFCRACECPVMGRVFQHEIGRRHTLNISISNIHKETRQKEDKKEEPEVMEVAPGEPAPPGFEEMGKTCQIQDKLDGFKAGPLVALEYLLELQDYDPSKEPFYLCILCDKRGDPRTVLTHLASYNHVSHYLQKHFPTCYRALAPFMIKQYKRNWQITLQKIAEGIEKKFGRLKPYPVDKDKFDKDKSYYFQLLGKGRHFSELSGYTFEELVVPDELTKVHDDEKNIESSAANNWGTSTFIEKPFKKKSPSPPVVAMPSRKNKGNQLASNPKSKGNQSYSQGKKPSPFRGVRKRSLSSCSSISSDDLSDAGNKRNKGGFKRGQKVNRSPVSRGRQLYNRNRSPSPIRRRSPSIPRRDRFREREDKERTEVSRKTKEKEEQDEKLRKIEEFRKLARAIENDMHKTLKQHEKNPEKHPQYSEEWKKFWNMRYKQLQAQGVDVAKYDFKPEWIEFWNKRMIELHSDELRNRKDALRKRLGLPDDINPIKFSIGSTGSASGQIVVTPKPNLPMAAQPDQDNEVILIDDRDDDKPARKRSHSPWERETSPKIRYGKRRSTPSPVRRRSSRSPNRKRPSPSPVRRRASPSPVRRRASPSPVRRRVASPSPVRRRAASPSPLRRRSRDRSPVRSASKERSREYYRISPSQLGREAARSKDGPSDRYMRSKEYEKDERAYSKERASPSVERIRERREYERKRVEYRESSFERDLKAKERIRTVADLPWEREKHYRSMYADYYQPPPVMRDVTRTPQIHPVPIDDDDDNTEVNVVDVLRILTALEERLGSLGPKVIDLLAQALALEKKEANSSENLLDNDLNCVLFETIKEKLKGQLLTGLVDIMQERAFKKAIKKIASLMHLAGDRKTKRERLVPKVKPLSVPGVGSVDRAAIAKQIANALIAQGKTDVTQAELEQLINAVVGMAEASKNSSKPVTTANFLQQLTGGTSTSNQSNSNSQDGLPSVSNKSDDNLDKLVEPLTPSPGKSSTKDMENLSDADLQTLLQNFKDLSTEEQHNLINYLKKLEYQEPERVEKLRSFVSLDGTSKSKDEESSDKKTKTSGRESPFANRHGSLNPASDDLVQIESDEDADMQQPSNQPDENKEEVEEKETGKIHVDSEEEDYSFEDVVKTASKAVKEKEKENDLKAEEEVLKKKELDLANAKDLISNLMSSISKRSNDASKGIDLLGLGTTSTAPVPVSSAPSVTPTSAPQTSMATVPVSTAEFAKNLSSISFDNLANIVSTVKNMTTAAEIDNKDRNSFVDTMNEKNLGFGAPPTTNRLNFDPSQLDKPSFESNKLGMNQGMQDGFYDRPYPSRDPQGFDRSFGMEPPFRSLGPDVARRNLGPPQGPEAPMRRGPEPTYRDDGPASFRDEHPPFMDRGPIPRMPMQRGTTGGLPPPFSNREGPGPRLPAPTFGGPNFGMRDRPMSNPFQNRPQFGNFQSQYPNPRGPRLNLLDRSRLGNPNDFNNRNNSFINRW